MSDDLNSLPNTKPTLIAAPTAKDSNKKGDVFGGWVMSVMDLAGGMAAHQLAQSAVSTVAVKELQFLQPLFVGDTVQVFTDIVTVGTTSVTMQIDAYVVNKAELATIRHIANGIFVYVAVSAPGKKQAIQR